MTTTTVRELKARGLWPEAKTSLGMNVPDAEIDDERPVWLSMLEAVDLLRRN